MAKFIKYNNKLVNLDCVFEITFAEDGHSLIILNLISTTISGDIAPFWPIVLKDQAQQTSVFNKIMRFIEDNKSGLLNIDNML